MVKSVLGKIWRRIGQSSNRNPLQTMAPTVPLERVIIGVGAQKSGTTWLASPLAQHPDILMRTKEVHYWDTVRAPYRKFDSALARILDSKGNTPGSPFGDNPLDHSRYVPSLEVGRTVERMVCEISPSYALCSQATFSAMKAVHDDVRFLFLMRDPVDRLWSGLRHKMRATLQRGASGDWLERMFLEACDDPHDPDFRRSRYEDTLTALEGAGCNVCVMFYETLFTEKSLNTIAEFIGVDRLEGEFDSRIHAGAAAELRLSAPARAHARKALAETYDAIAHRFGDQVPAKWLK